jgi:hypothetical protein
MIFQRRLRRTDAVHLHISHFPWPPCHGSLRGRSTRSKVKAFSLAELADYAAFVSLANPAADGDAPADSLLAVFDHARTPGTEFALTDHDRTFLAGLYGSAANQGGMLQRSASVRGMRKATALDH